MQQAIEEARLAPSHADVPVGAIAVADCRIVARAHNEREKRADATAHAEVLALRAASELLGTWRLDGLTMVVTIEPCVMCAGALLNARVERVVFGAFDPKAGALGSLYNVGVDPRLNHELEVLGGVMADESGQLLSQFFADRR
ncbi:MAG: tRNA-specific adenosine deaminase [Acidimicrobiales bacterium]|nr:MAG: nucleoside deaminase [Actinomycetota bacterium]MBV6510452.1 tRNA-specific adenosine deaminase [Acidimicrobiales bacterium]RIK02156.1 MAG: tRNA-specific adenosine deaminase [Acidobacteriota bacterium]